MRERPIQVQRLNLGSGQSRNTHFILVIVEVSTFPTHSSYSQTENMSYTFFGGVVILVSIDCPMIQRWYEFTCSYLWNGMLIGRTWRLKHHRNGGKRSQRWGNIYAAWHPSSRPTLPPTNMKKEQQTCFCPYKVLSVQTVRAVSFLEMAQRDGDRQGGGGWGWSSRASYVWPLWCECHNLGHAQHLLENSSG